MQLTNYEVVAAEVEDDKSLRLDFADGQALRLIDDSERYESMQIYRGEQLWIMRLWRDVEKPPPKSLTKPHFVT